MTRRLSLEKHRRRRDALLRRIARRRAALDAMNVTPDDPPAVRAGHTHRLRALARDEKALADLKGMADTAAD